MLMDAVMLQIYVYDAADYDEPLLVEELADIEEAVSRCHELVEDDGHARAEAWDPEGDCRYGVALRAGAVRTYGAPHDTRNAFAEKPVADDATARDATAEDAIVAEAAADGSTVRAERADEALADRDAPSDRPPADSAPPPEILLGERPARPDLWFGV